MAAFKSIQIIGNFPISGVGMGGRVSHNERGEYNLTAALATGDTIDLFFLPRNARILRGFIKTDVFGAGSSFNVGDIANPSRYFTATAIGVAGGVDRNLAATGTDYNNTSKQLVRLTCVAGTAVTVGQIVVVLNYACEEPA